MCKYSEHCSNGQIWINNTFQGRCECKRQEFIEFFYKWSNAPKKYKQQIEALRSYDIYFESKKEQAIDSIEEMNELLANVDDLIRDRVTILLKGTPGSGKTSWAITFAIETIKRLDLSKAEVDFKRFYYLSLSALIREKKIFDTQTIDEIFRKIRKSDILIIDDLAEELELGATDKRKDEVLNMLKTITDEFEGLMIITTNHPRIEQAYEEEMQRLHSRLFGDIEKRNTILEYLFAMPIDLRDERQSNSVNRLKARFRKGGDQT